VIPLEAIEAARERIAGSVVRTPLVPLELPESPARIFLKLENLQPIGSFKLRGALNAIALAPPDALRAGVVTPSAGNMGQGVAWAARERGLPCTVVVPETAPETKLDALERLGARVVPVPYERWWQALLTAATPDAEGFFVHPAQDDDVIAGNATIGLELLEDLRQPPDAVLIPYGGGGLAVGIASALRALSPRTRIYAVEPATASPLTASFAAGESVAVDARPSFVDGAGAPQLLPKMWPLAREVLDGAFGMPLDEVAGAVRLLATRARVVAEGAGALALAAALAGDAGGGTIVCIVSGGNIDATRLATILRGGIS
jgi:threonine dehydratase